MSSLCQGAVSDTAYVYENEMYIWHFEIKCQPGNDVLLQYILHSIANCN